MTTMRTLPDADLTVLADSDRVLANLHLAAPGVTGTFDVHDPATGRVIAQVPDFTAHQSLDAVPSVVARPDRGTGRRQSAVRTRAAEGAGPSACRPPPHAARRGRRRPGLLVPR